MNAPLKNGCQIAVPKLHSARMKMMAEDVRHLATLARLDVPEADLDPYAKELGSILEYVERMQRIETSNVEPFCLPAKKDGWREDFAEDCDDVARVFILDNFPQQLGGLLAAPGVFKHPKQ